MKRSDEDFKAEIEAHVALETDRLIAEGVSPQPAREAAVRKFGNVTAVREQFYESTRVLWFDQLRQDARYALRSFARTPGFTVVVVLTLALGIGANTAIFSVVNALLLRPLPYTDSDRLVRIVEESTALPGTPAGVPRVPTGINAIELAALRSQAHTVSHLGIFTPPTSMTLTARSGAVRLEGVRVSPTILQAIRPTLMAGRLFDPGEELTGADAVVILSHAAWQQHFGGKATVVGESVMLDGRAYSIVGIMSAGFRFPDAATQFWMPLVLPAGRLATLQRMVPVARLNDGVGIETARDEVRSILAQFRQTTGAQAAVPPPPPPPGAPAPPPPAPGGWTALAAPPAPQVNLIRLQDQLVGPVRPALIVLSVAVGFVLLIACVNVANLLLARSAAREREIAVRKALGASPGRLVRQALTESLLLSCAGGIAGTGVALGGVQLLRTFAMTLARRDIGQGAALPRLDEVGFDASIFTFMLAISVVTGLIFGLAPALRHRRFTHTAMLREAGASSISGFNLLERHRLQGLLIVSEIAMATMVLVGGGLLMRSFVKLASVDPGYDVTNVLTFQVFLPRALNVGAPVPFAEDLVARLERLPGVSAAAYSEQLPTGNRRSSLVLRTTAAMPRMPPAPPPFGAPAPPETPDTRFVSGDYLTVMGIQIVEGRGFDDSAGPRAILINQTLARSGFLGDTPIGKQVYTLGTDPWEIVGIVEDVRLYGLDSQPGAQLFFDLRRLRTLPPAATGGQPPGRVDYFAVRTAGDPAAAVSSIRGIVAQLEPQAIVDSVATLEQIVSYSIARPRLYAVLLGIFAGVAVMLAAVGIYGVMAYAVTQRVREIGIRMALGARRTSVMRLVLGQSAILTGLGITAGLAGAAALTRYLERLLFGLTPLDPATFAGVAVLFGVVATLAAVVPARRATRVDPVVALRCE